MRIRALIAGFPVFVAGVAVGVYSVMTSWNGQVFIPADNQPAQTRDPAAIRKNFDFSHLDGGALKVASQKRLVEDAKIVRDGNDFGIELGHFVTKGDDGQKEFACGFFDKVVLTFKAEGIAESGERPALRIEAPCRMGQVDVNRMAPILIPVQRIMNEKPANMALKFPEINDTTFDFQDMPSEWPLDWVLSSVQLRSEGKKDRDIVISEDEVIETRGSDPIILNWGSN